ncbi:hypothetical protein FWG95_00885 [Candidatus Saccharibacteria bacterium]|nr:hypothetical protein [Candidatus Saccharibacteria bacterium]
MSDVTETLPTAAQYKGGGREALADIPSEQVEATLGEIVEFLKRSIKEQGVAGTVASLVGVDRFKGGWKDLGIDGIRDFFGIPHKEKEDAGDDEGEPTKWDKIKENEGDRKAFQEAQRMSAARPFVQFGIEFWYTREFYSHAGNPPLTTRLMYGALTLANLATDKKDGDTIRSRERDAATHKLLCEMTPEELANVTETYNPIKTDIGATVDEMSDKATFLAMELFRVIRGEMSLGNFLSRLGRDLGMSEIRDNVYRKTEGVVKVAAREFSDALKNGDIKTVLRSGKVSTLLRDIIDVLVTTSGEAMPKPAREIIDVVGTLAVWNSGISNTRAFVGEANVFAAIGEEEYIERQKRIEQAAIEAKEGHERDKTEGYVETLCRVTDRLEQEGLLEYVQIIGGFLPTILATEGAKYDKHSRTIKAPDDPEPDMSRLRIVKKDGKEINRGRRDIDMLVVYNDGPERERQLIDEILARNPEIRDEIAASKKDLDPNDPEYEKKLEGGISLSDVIEIIARSAANGELEVSTFDILNAGELKNAMTLPKDRKAVLSDRYRDKNGVIWRALSPLMARAEMKPEVMETWYVEIRGHRIPVSRPATAIYDYMLRFVSGIKSKDDDKIDAVIENCPEVVKDMKEPEYEELRGMAALQNTAFVNRGGKARKVIQRVGLDAEFLEKSGEKGDAAKLRRLTNGAFMGGWLESPDLRNRRMAREVMQRTRVIAGAFLKAEETVGPVYQKLVESTSVGAALTGRKKS